MIFSKSNKFSIVAISFLICATTYSTVNAMDDNYGNDVYHNNNYHNNVNVSEKEILDYLNQEDKTVISTAEHFGMLPEKVKELYKKSNHKADAISTALSWDE